MLILPYQTRFALRSAPVVTLALILVNALVFFVAQANDDRAYERAFTYYEQSSLPRVELPRYRAWLARQPDDADTREQLHALQAALAARSVEEALALMQDDADFMRALRGLAVVTPEDPAFLTWRDERNRFEALLAGAATDRFALERGATQPWRFITYQFLHGDLGHWLGNMIVLLLAGSFAEPALGRLRFLAGYLIAGAAAGALHLALSDAAVIGASGAIAGAMAMVAVLYGRRRVPVFVWILFYFATIRVPALGLLPVWLANEIGQWLLDAGTDIAYVAHAGGLLAGALFALLLRPRSAAGIERVLEKATGVDAEESGRRRLEQRARLAAEQLDTARASALYAELADQYPSHTEYAVANLNLALLGGDRGLIHAAAHRVLALRPKHIAADLRRAYLQLAQERTLQMLTIDERLRLARRLVRARDDAAALQLLDALLADEQVRAEHARALSDCLLGLFTTYTRHRLVHQAEDVRRRLQRYFPRPDPTFDVATDAAMQQASPTTTNGPSTLNFDLPR